jgi:hypothetical protein
MGISQIYANAASTKDAGWCRASLFPALLCFSAWEPGRKRVGLAEVYGMEFTDHRGPVRAFER